MLEIDIILYHGGSLKNANANKGLPFEGLGIKTYYTQIDRRLKTLDELKMMVWKSCVRTLLYTTYTLLIVCQMKS